MEMSRKRNEKPFCLRHGATTRHPARQTPDMRTARELEEKKGLSDQPRLPEEPNVSWQKAEWPSRKAYSYRAPTGSWHLGSSFPPLHGMSSVVTTACQGTRHSGNRS